MSAIITTNRDGICAICQQSLRPEERKLTHVGGEGHEGFHPSCLKYWVMRNPTCPYDRQPIDPTSLISRTDRIMARLPSALSNTAYVACFGTAVAGTGAIAGAAGGVAAAAATV